MNTNDGARAAVIGGTGVLVGRFSECLAAAGAAVMALGRPGERGKVAVERIVASGNRASSLPVNVAEEGWDTSPHLRKVADNTSLNRVEL
jgi:NAD(P)-dependent dehydrogenase (short-subunit alcohol dehydrogenase family)